MEAFVALDDDQPADGRNCLGVEQGRDHQQSRMISGR